MAKGQMKGNREAKKPKKKKEPVASPVVLKGVPASAAPSKKKG